MQILNAFYLDLFIPKVIASTRQHSQCKQCVVFTHQMEASFSLILASLPMLSDNKNGISKSPLSQSVSAICACLSEYNSRLHNDS